MDELLTVEITDSGRAALPETQLVRSTRPKAESALRDCFPNQHVYVVLKKMGRSDELTLAVAEISGRDSKSALREALTCLLAAGLDVVAG
jgi:hypothetical protein